VPTNPYEPPRSTQPAAQPFSVGVGARMARGSVSGILVGATLGAVVYGAMALLSVVADWGAAHAALDVALLAALFELPVFGVLGAAGGGLLGAVLALLAPFNRSSSLAAGSPDSLAAVAVVLACWLLTGSVMGFALVANWSAPAAIGVFEWRLASGLVGGFAGLAAGRMNARMLSRLCRRAGEQSHGPRA